MVNRHTKFEVSTITCNEDMKGYAKCKNSRFEPPLGGHRGIAQGSSVFKFSTQVGHISSSNRMTYHAQKGRGYGHETVLKFCGFP